MLAPMAPTDHGAVWVRRRWGTLAGRFVLALLLSLVSAELILQVASFLAPDRSGSWSSEAETRILCVGDSHTWGAGVERDQTYPAQLQSFLDQEKPGVYSVMNLGLPGMSTTQLRNRLPVSLSRYRPDRLVLWAGVNNAWNTAEIEERPSSWLAWADRQLISTRLYRLARLRVHDRKLERYSHEHDSPDLWRIDHVERKVTAGARFTVKHDGLIESIQHRPGEAPDASQIEPRSLRDLREMVELARAADIELVFITYPLIGGWYEKANSAMWRVSQEYRIPLVRSHESLRRVPEEKREWLWAMHPGAAIYQEIARDVARIILADGSS